MKRVRFSEGRQYNSEKDQIPLSTYTLMPFSLQQISIYLIIILSLCSFSAVAQNQAVILQYHHVSTETPPITSISPEGFERHIDYLQINDFQVMALETVINNLRNGTPLPDKTAVITFDDGYTSVYEAAFPLLKTIGWPFTVFVTSGLVGSNDRLYATWDQIREMANNGATIANHTISHPYLLQREEGLSQDEWLAQVEHEIVGAEEIITEETGQNHKLLAYPYGEYNDAIKSLVQILGYTGIAQHSGPINATSDFLALPRFPLSGIYASMNTYPTKMMSLAFNMEAIAPSSPITSSKSPEAILNFTNDQAGLGQLVCFNNNELISSVLENEEENQYRISTHIENSTRRFRYNCTAPAGSGRIYWYSIPWVNPDIAE